MKIRSEEPPLETLVLPGATGEWELVKPFPRTSTQYSYVSGNPESRAIRIQYFQSQRGNRFAGRAWFGPESEGPPGHAHGGSQAALLDEGMGAAAWHGKMTVLAAKLEINFRRPLPLGTQVTLWTEITKIEGRKVYISGRLEGDDGKVFSEGTGLFVMIDLKKFSSIV